MLRTDQALYELYAVQFFKVSCSQFVMWLISQLINNPSFIDCAWALAHFNVGVMIATSSLTDFSRLSNPYILIGFLMLLFWFMRLGGFILNYRIIHVHADPRYTALVEGFEKWKTYLFFFIQFQFQGALATFCCIPLCYVFKLDGTRKIEVLNYLGIILCCIGVTGEAIADAQLQSWKDFKRPDEKTFRDGLFKRARHPNLFFELVYWIGMSCYAFTSAELYSLSAFIGPLLLWSAMYFVTIPITSTHMKKTRPDYEDIIKETNLFLPF